MRILLVVPNYPNLNKANYKFVHDRVKEYKKELEVDVFCYNNSKEQDYIYESINVCVGGKKKLKSIIDKYDVYIFHFLNFKNAKFIFKYLKDKKVFIWFHGTDCISYKRRIPKNCYENKKHKNLYKTLKSFIYKNLNIVKLNLIRKIEKVCSNVTFVFVSNWLKNACETDIGINFKRYGIINNYINVNYFKYKKKNEIDRLHVLSIMNYSNDIYAGDILQDILLKFSKREEFKKFTFDIYGEGKLFQKYTEKIQNFENIHLNRKVLKQEEIRNLHDLHGIFLYPKRGDSQGVSRCEAMASGLVSIASNVEAIGEFSPPDTTYLVNNINEFIDSLINIYNRPNDFLKKSAISSQFINKKCNYNETIKKEIELLKEEVK